MNELEIWRKRYEHRPRTIEKQMVRLARGDRGCLFDAISALGALLTAALVVLSNLEMLPQSAFWLGVLVWAGGFVSGTVYQTRDGKRRKQALRDGLFSLGWVVEVDSEFGTPAAGKRAMRGLVLLGVTPSRADDPVMLEKAAKKLAQHLQAADKETLPVALRSVFSDSFYPEIVEVPAEQVGVDGYALARVVLYPNRLLAPWNRSRPIVGLITHPELRFVEQVPGDE